MRTAATPCSARPARPLTTRPRSSRRRRTGSASSSQRLSGTSPRPERGAGAGTGRRAPFGELASGHTHFALLPLTKFTARGRRAVEATRCWCVAATSLGDQGQSLRPRSARSGGSMPCRQPRDCANHDDADQARRAPVSMRTRGEDVSPPSQTPRNLQGETQSQTSREPEPRCSRRSVSRA